MKKVFLGLLILGAVLVLVNLAFLDFWVLADKKETPVSKTSLPEVIPTLFEEPQTLASPSCELACQELIDEKIKQELSVLPSLAGQSSVSPVASNKPSVGFIPLITQGGVSSATWTEVVPSDFYFNLADYPGVKEVRFEAYLFSSNNDLVYARLYDVTNKRGVDFSDLSTSNSQYTLVASSPITLWRGNNKYVLQLRSVNGTQVLIKEAKLKIIY